MEQVNGRGSGAVTLPGKPPHHDEPHGVLQDVERAVVDTAHRVLQAAEIAFHLPSPPKSRWHRAGVSRRSEKLLDIVGGMVLLMFAVGWTWSVSTAAARTDGAEAVGRMSASISNALVSADAPTTAFLTQAALRALTPLRGESGRLRAQFREPGTPLGTDSLPAGAVLEYSADGVIDSARTDSMVRSPDAPGVWQLAIKLGAAIRPLSDFNVITLTPFSAKQRGRIGLYYLGSWPNELARGRARYTLPRGFIEVTAGNRHTWVSEHFRLGDFLTKNQPAVWPKYLVLEVKLLDKLELVLTELRAQGVDTRGVKVLSGFRTPQYNRSGGDPRGRAALSRHMYGDAADIFIDNDGDGRMDDINHDGRINIDDARMIQSAVDRVDREHPDLVGGCGIYHAGPGHGPFTHIDTRGFRARWIGSGD